MKVVIAMDSSQASQVALEQVAARPWPEGSYFEVVGVAEPSHLWTTAEVALEEERRAHEVVGRAVERLRAARKDAVGVVYSGDPKSVVLDCASRLGADFLVVESGFGNLAATILRYAPCSVEVVRGGGKTSSGGLKILLATDGSGFSEQAAKSIASRPWPDGASVRILSAVELVLPAARALFEVPLLDAEFLESARADAMKRAQDAVARARAILAATGLSLEESISVLADTPGAVILQEAREWAADLIVLGSHGRHGMDRFLVGSVSEAVAMHADCSVEVIR